MNQVLLNDDGPPASKLDYAFWRFWPTRSLQNFEKHFTANPIYISADKCVSLVENLTHLTKKGIAARLSREMPLDQSV